MTDSLDNSNNYLFMITTHGKNGKLDSKFIEECVKFIREISGIETKNIFIGFDGDGAYGNEWPMPSTTAVTLVYELLQLKLNVGLVQSQVFSYAEPPAKYSQVCLTNLIGTNGNNKKIKVDFYDPYQNTIEDESNPKPQVYKEVETEGLVTGGSQPETSYQPWKIVEDQVDDSLKVPFYTIAYNVPTDDEKRKQKPHTHYDSVVVPYGVDGKMGNKLTVLQTEGIGNQEKVFLKEILVRGPNGKYVDLYGGSSSVKGGKDLEGTGEFAGSTDAWVKSKFMKHIPQNQRYLLCFWDEDEVGEEENSYELSISRRTSDMLLSKREIGKSILFFNKKGGEKNITYETRNPAMSMTSRLASKFSFSSLRGSGKSKKIKRRLGRKRTRNLRKN